MENVGWPASGFLELIGPAAFCRQAEIDLYT